MRLDVLASAAHSALATANLGNTDRPTVNSLWLGDIQPRLGLREVGAAVPIICDVMLESGCPGEWRFSRIARRLAYLCHTPFQNTKTGGKVSNSVTPFFWDDSGRKPLSYQITEVHIHDSGHLEPSYLTSTKLNTITFPLLCSRIFADRVIRCWKKEIMRFRHCCQK